MTKEVKVIDPLTMLIDRAREMVKTMSPEERSKMRAAQGRSWVVGEMMLEDENLTLEEANRRVDAAISSPAISGRG